MSHHQGLFIAAEQEGPLADRCLMISWEEPRRVAAFRGRASPQRRLSLPHPDRSARHSPHTATPTSTSATTTTSYLKNSPLPLARVFQNGQAGTVYVPLTVKSESVKSCLPAGLKPILGGRKVSDSLLRTEAELKLSLWNHRLAVLTSYFLSLLQTDRRKTGVEMAR